MTDLARAIKIAKELEFRQRTNLMKLYKPYPYQLKFHNSHASQRLLMAGNRVGKSFCGAMEMAYHCTGLYPNWWKGKKFNRPVRCWVGGVSNEISFDTHMAHTVPSDSFFYEIPILWLFLML